MQLKPDSAIPKDFENFLKNSENKTDLFHLIAENIGSTVSSKILVSTQDQQLFQIIPIDR